MRRTLLAAAWCAGAAACGEEAQRAAPASDTSAGLVAPSPRSSTGIAQVCTANAWPGLHVSVFDAQAGAPPPTGAQVVARDGAFADTAGGEVGGGARSDVRGRPAVQFSLAYERRGTYALQVTAPGYRTWRNASVRVDQMTDDGCHIVAEHVEAELARASTQLP